MRKTKIFQLIKLLLFPGIDLHTRCRYKTLPEYFIEGNIVTLDAGCGNGCLSYAAYKKGNKVIGVSSDSTSVEKNKVFYDALKIDRSRLNFRIMNLYEIESIGCKFDQIICSETLEHILDDKSVIKSFYNILNTKGVLHLCCPNSLHDEHNLGRVSVKEDGGHVRDGYTYESYKQLLEPIGFKIVEHVGIGSPVVVKLDRFIRAIKNIFGQTFVVPLVFFALPLILLDKVNPKVPYSLYVKCVKE